MEFKTQWIIDQQNDLMLGINNALTIVISIAARGQQEKSGAQIQLSQDLLKYLANIAGSDVVDTDIAAEMISMLMEFLKSNNKVAVDFFLKNMRKWMSPELFVEVKAVFISDLTKQRTHEFIALLKNNELPEKVGYLLLFRHQNKDVLEKVIFDTEINIKFRLYAFSYYAAQFIGGGAKGRDSSEPEIYDEDKLQAMQSALADEAERFLKSIRSNNKLIDSLIDDVWLQNEVVYITAVMLVLEKKVALLNAKAYVAIARKIISAKVLRYNNGAWSDNFHIGGLLLKKNPNSMDFFLQVIAHELMHNILIEQYGYINLIQPGDLGQEKVVRSVVHELLSDVYAFILSDIIDIDVESFMEALDYDAQLKAVSSDSYYTAKAHAGARAQWKIIRDRSLFWKVKIDLVRFLKSAIAVVTCESNKDDRLNIIINKIFEYYNGDYTPQEKKKNVLKDRFYDIFIKRSRHSGGLKERILDADLIDFHLRGMIQQMDKAGGAGLFIGQAI